MSQYFFLNSGHKFENYLSIWKLKNIKISLFENNWIIKVLNN